VRTCTAPVETRDEQSCPQNFQGSSPEADVPAATTRAPLINLPRLRNAEPSQRRQLIIVSTVTVVWFAFTVWASSFWFNALADAVGLIAAIFFIGGLALVPSAMNMFVVASLLLDRRPRGGPWRATRHCRC